MLEMDVPLTMAVTAISAVLGGHFGAGCAAWLRREVAPVVARTRRRD